MDEGLLQNACTSRFSCAGLIVEVFEWKTGAIASAHENLDVQAFWGRYPAVCDYVPLHELPEAKDMFAQFVPIDL